MPESAHELWGSLDSDMKEKICNSKIAYAFRVFSAIARHEDDWDMGCGTKEISSELSGSTEYRVHKEMVELGLLEKESKGSYRIGETGKILIRQMRNEGKLGEY
jgi:hypothetical protein